MLELKYAKLESLVPYDNNARKHPKKQLEKLAASIKNFGFLAPVVIDRRCILAGHARVEAAKLAGLTEVPTVSVEHLTEAQKRAFILADNRLTEDAAWDLDILKKELAFLGDLDLADLTGFETAEIDLLFKEDFCLSEDQVEKVPSGYQPVTQEGDVWELEGWCNCLCLYGLAAHERDAECGPWPA